MREYMPEPVLIFLLRLIKDENPAIADLFKIADRINLEHLIEVMNSFYEDFGIRLFVSFHNPIFLIPEAVSVPSAMPRIKQTHDTLVRTDHIKTVLNQLNDLNNHEKLDLLKQTDLMFYLSKQVIIHMNLEASYKEKIQMFLGDYLKDYEEENLYVPQQNVLHIRNHFNAFLGLTNQLVVDFGVKNIFVKQDVNNSHESGQYRLLEFFLLMEKKGFIRIKNIHPNENKRVIKWDLTIDILRDHNEIKSLYFDWVSFGDLHFRPESGHSKHQDIQYQFKTNTNGYKVLKRLMKAPNNLFHVEMLAKEVLDEPKDASLIKCREVVHDTIHKRIRPHLGLDNPNSRVDILSHNDHYFLTAKPI